MNVGVEDVYALGELLGTNNSYKCFKTLVLIEIKYLSRFKPRLKDSSSQVSSLGKGEDSLLREILVWAKLRESLRNLIVWLKVLSLEIVNLDL